LSDQHPLGIGKRERQIGYRGNNRAALKTTVAPGETYHKKKKAIIAKLDDWSTPRFGDQTTTMNLEEESQNTITRVTNLRSNRQRKHRAKGEGGRGSKVREHKLTVSKVVNQKSKKSTPT